MQANLLGHDIVYDDSGQGRALLLMHAFPLDRRMFAPQRAGLAESLRLITFDVPGAGESAPGVVSIDGIADIAAALLDRLGIDQAVVGGVSMGGYAAFSFARRHSGRLRGVILANTRAVADTDEGKVARKAMAAVAIEQGAAEIANRMLEKLLGATTLRERPAVVSDVRAMIESTPPKTIAMLLDALANREDSTATLSTIDVPALAIAGEEDPLAPPAETAGWAAQIPDARFVAIKRAGHLACLEDSAAFNRSIVEFASGLP
jgi:pimeloyl-ACP methyl ester carboxylesterase